MSEERAVIVIAGGGTGGHVFPGLAIAQRLRDLCVEVVWFGTANGVEASRVPDMGYQFERLGVGGVRQKGVFAWLFLPWRLTLALWQAGVLLLKYRPKLVLGMGGYASGPTGLAAYVLNIPLVIHEQNTIAGLTNRYLAKLSRRVLLGFPGALCGRRVQWVGNPVREQLLNAPPPRERFAHRHGALRLLIMGGSRGATMLNEILPPTLKQMDVTARPEVWHQSGEHNEDVVRDAYMRAGVAARVDAFIDDMTEALRWADLVVCRAGAQTLAEIAALGVASILVPFPYATDDHQTKNADYYACADAAVLLPQSELTPDKLASVIHEMDGARSRLIDMATRARALACPFASEKIAAICRTEMAA